MSDIFDILKGREVRRYSPGQNVLQQGDETGCLFFLIEGSVDILKDNVRVASASEPGVVFGELAAILGVHHTATVRAVTESSFFVVEGAADFLKSSPEMSHFICKLLARRLDSINCYFVEVKKRFEGHELIDPMIGALEALLHAQPTRLRPVKRPRS